MVEIGAIRIYPVMAVQASACKSSPVCLDKLVVYSSMAVLAGCNLEAGQSGWMAVSADERLVAIYLVTGQGITGYLVREA